VRPKALVLHANGTNRDREAAQAFELAGADAEIVHLNQLRAGVRRWADYQLLAIPGGFSHADALGAGRLLAVDLRVYFAEELRAFIAAGKPVIGICNGFQALVRAGLLPDDPSGRARATLTFNASGRFECRWVHLAPVSRTCVWTRDLAGTLHCPVAHGEGRLVLAEPRALETLRAGAQVALLYADARGQPAGGAYPANPNGSLADVAGLCNATGTVLGLMPHPEDHVFPEQHPRRARGEAGGLGLNLFVNGVRYAADL
jgi:phosphoribosylformylglycinamidine synthase